MATAVRIHCSFCCTHSLQLLLHTIIVTPELIVALALILCSSCTHLLRLQLQHAFIATTALFRYYCSMHSLQLQHPLTAAPVLIDCSSSTHSLRLKHSIIVAPALIHCRFCTHSLWILHSFNATPALIQCHSCNYSLPLHY